MGLQLKHLIIAAGVGVAGIGVATLGQHLDRETYKNVRIVDTERIVESGMSSEGPASVSSKYLVFTKLENGENRVFENTDSPLEWKMDSANYQAELKSVQGTDRQCTLKTYGWRVPFFSLYENIIDVECK